MQEMAFQGLYISKFSRGSMPPDPPTGFSRLRHSVPQAKRKLYAYDYMVHIVTSLK